MRKALFVIFIIVGCTYTPPSSKPCEEVYKPVSNYIFKLKEYSRYKMIELSYLDSIEYIKSVKRSGRRAKFENIFINIDTLPQFIEWVLFKNDTIILRMRSNVSYSEVYNDKIISYEPNEMLELGLTYVGKINNYELLGSTTWNINDCPSDCIHYSLIERFKNSGKFRYSMRDLAPSHPCAEKYNYIFNDPDSWFYPKFSYHIYTRYYDSNIRNRVSESAYLDRLDSLYREKYPEDLRRQTDSMILNLHKCPLRQ